MAKKYLKLCYQIKFNIYYTNAYMKTNKMGENLSRFWKLYIIL